MSNISSPSTTSRTRPGWLVPVAVVGAVILIIVIAFSSSYNGMVHKRNATDQAFSQIDVELQRQFDLIPNIVNSVKGAQAQEQSIIGQIAQARTQYFSAKTTDGKVTAANDFQVAVAGLQSIQENYPDLQSNQDVQNLITELEGSQNRITQARRDYNNAVTEYNNSIQTFPRNIAAGIFGFSQRTLFQANPAAQQTPTVNLTPTPSTTATTSAP